MSDMQNGEHHITVNDQFRQVDMTKVNNTSHNQMMTANNHTNNKQQQKIKIKSLTHRLLMCFVCAAPTHKSHKSVDSHTGADKVTVNVDKQYSNNNNNSFATRPQADTTANTTSAPPQITVQQQSQSLPQPAQQQASKGIDSLVTQVQQVPYPSTLPQLTAQQLTAHINHQPPPAQALLPPLSPADVAAKKKCLVLDLDETLVHSSFKPINDADFVMTIELENVLHRVYVRKRPGVDHFLKVVGELFEVIIFTASLAKYADPLLDILDKSQSMQGRLFREACVQHYGNYVKDLSHLGRKLEHCIIIDNSPFSYMFQPEHAIPITSWFNDKSDRQLYELIPFLEQMASSDCDDICQILSKKRFNF